MGEKISLFLLRIIRYIYVLFIILFIIGFYNSRPPVFVTFTSIVEVFMGLFLVYRFNPVFNRQISFTKLDREIIMFSAIFILVSSFTDYVNLLLIYAQNIVKEIIKIEK